MDAVACEHVFVHRLTSAVRRGPWVSLPSAEGRIYYLNLRTSWSRWDPPPLWEAGWLRRVSQDRSVEDVPSRVPAAVPRGREVCGGAPVGVDVAAALRPCVAQVMAVVLGSGHEQEVGSHGAVLARPAVAHADPTFGQRLSELRACMEALAEATGVRFAVPCSAVLAALWQLCPVWVLMEPAYLERCLAGRRTGRHGEALSQLQLAVDELSGCLRSVGRMTHVLLPVVLSAGGGFHAA